VRKKEKGGREGRRKERERGRESFKYFLAFVIKSIKSFLFPRV
jgi:hypothetical protein